VITDLDKLRISLSQLTERVDYTESKLQTIEKHMPTIIEQLIVFGLEERIDKKLEGFVKQQDMAKELE
jgi:hypothetical protein